MSTIESAFRVTWLCASVGLIAGIVAAPAQAATAPPASQPTAQAVTQVLNETVHIPGTTWGTDPTSNEVVVQLDDTVDDAELGQIETAVRPFGDAVRVERFDGRLTTLIRGGHAIFTGPGTGARCTLGFNVRGSTGAEAFLTAGHCTNQSTRWYNHAGVHLGPTVGSHYPGQDSGLVRHDNDLPHPGGPRPCHGERAKDVNGAVRPAIGMWVERTGSVSCGVRGQITGLNVTINYGDGPVRGLFRANVCAKPGDSGGPLYTLSGDAVGILSGGILHSGPCDAAHPQGTTFYEPVVRAAQAYNVRVVT